MLSRQNIAWVHELHPYELRRRSKIGEIRNGPVFLIANREETLSNAIDDMSIRGLESRMSKCSLATRFAIAD